MKGGEEEIMRKSHAEHWDLDPNFRPLDSLPLCYHPELMWSRLEVIALMAFGFMLAFLIAFLLFLGPFDSEHEAVQDTSMDTRNGLTHLGL